MYFIKIFEFSIIARILWYFCACAIFALFFIGHFCHFSLDFNILVLMTEYFKCFESCRFSLYFKILILGSISYVGFEFSIECKFTSI